MKQQHPSAAPTLPEQLQGTRAGVFHLLNQQLRQQEPEPTPIRPKQQATQTDQDHKLPTRDARWRNLLEADNFLFLD
jgi:hypothetical protein